MAQPAVSHLPRRRLCLQELLEHPFLRPTAAPTTGLVGVTRSQLRKLLAQLSAVAPAEDRTDIDALSEEVFKQLSKGDAVDLAALLSRPKPAGVPPCSVMCIKSLTGLETSPTGGDGGEKRRLMCSTGSSQRGASQSSTGSAKEDSTGTGQTAGERLPAQKGLSSLLQDL